MSTPIARPAGWRAAPALLRGQVLHPRAAVEDRHLDHLVPTSRVQGAPRWRQGVGPMVPEVGDRRDLRARVEIEKEEGKEGGRRIRGGGNGEVAQPRGIGPAFRGSPQEAGDGSGQSDDERGAGGADRHAHQGHDDVAEQHAEAEHDRTQCRQGVEPGEGWGHERHERRARVTSPYNRLTRPRSRMWAIRGRDHRSNQRTRPSNAPWNRGEDSAGSSLSCHRAGSQISRRPTMSSSAKSMVATSSTWVTPPVGRGSAGSAISRTNTTAKLCGPNRATKPPIVLVVPSPNHSSSWTLKRSPAAPRYPTVCLLGSRRRTGWSSVRQRGTEQ